MNYSEHESKYIRAKERVDAIKSFYTSLISYVIFLSFLAGLNYFINEWSYPWFLWAAFGWGIGLSIKAFKAFSAHSFILGSEWEERKMKEFMNESDEIRF